MLDKTETAAVKYCRCNSSSIRAWCDSFIGSQMRAEMKRINSPEIHSKQNGFLLTRPSFKRTLSRWGRVGWTTHCRHRRHSLILRSFVQLFFKRLPSNLRWPTIREMRAFSYAWSLRSRDKSGGHIIRSAVAENPMLHATLTALCFIEPQLWPIDVLHCWNMDFWPYCVCDLYLDQMTFIYELNPCCLEI